MKLSNQQHFARNTFLTNEQQRAYLENAQFKYLVDTLFTVLVPGLLRVFHEEAEKRQVQIDEITQARMATLDPEMARSVAQFIDYAQFMDDTEDES